VSTSHNPARNHQVTSDPQWIPPSYGYVFFWTVYGYVR
jgi:hypothetical protein